ncbi:6-phospho-3-hexuloisomerase [Empedobacter brevis]|uniref:6-phospho-3-hexuloisomerase n=1 Tax=Empedobacter brevis TaxID=247 RepID=UPI0039AFF9BF
MNTENNSIKNLNTILRENEEVLQYLDEEALIALEQEIKKAKRLFFVGAGRTGLALKMAAMRFMHLGFEVYVVGETTTPAILEGDLLIVGSGSGTTSTLVIAAEKAKKQHARIFAITADENSKLATIADKFIVIKAAVKTDFGEATSQQYAGSLFEQTILLVLDAVFMLLWQKSGLTKEDLWPKHANLE